MLKQLSCFQFQRASLSDSSHISAKHGIVLFGPVPKYLWGEIYNRVLSSASLFLWSLHSSELAPQFGMVSSVLLKASFCRWGASLFLIVCFTTKLTFSHLDQPSCFANLQVTIALEPLAFPSLPFPLGLFSSWYLKGYLRRERELCPFTPPGEENPKPCPLSVGTVFAFSHLLGAMKYHCAMCSKTPGTSW